MDQDIQTQEGAGEQESTQVETHQPSDIEVRAMEMGWRPKEEWDGSDDDFIEAKEYVRRKPLFDKIEHQSRELKEIKKTLTALQEHHKAVKETEFKRALEYLKAEKVKALEEGDAHKAAELDDQILDVREKQKEAKAAQGQPSPEQQELHPDFVQWVGNNKWYQKDAELREFADSVGQAYAKAHPGVDPTVVLKHVSERVKKAYPEKFSNPNREKSPSVDGGSSSGRSRSSDSFELTPDEEKVMKTFIRQGIMTKDEYIKQLKSVKGVA